MKLLIMGPQGSGKGTQAQILKDKLGIPHISTGDMFRQAAEEKTETGLKAKEYWGEGNLVPDDVTNKLVEERLGKEDCQKGFILDGYPRTTEQAKKLDEVTEIDAVLLINISDEEAVKRIGGRRTCKDCGNIYHVIFNPAPEGKCDCGGELMQREDDTEEKIKARLATYHAQTEPVVQYYKEKGLLKKVEGADEIKETTKRVQEAIL